MRELGVPLRQSNCSNWEVLFQQLVRFCGLAVPSWDSTARPHLSPSLSTHPVQVDFGNANRHFNIPYPAPDDDQVKAKTRLHNFVRDLHLKHRHVGQGGPDSFLTLERRARLDEIGFKFAAAGEGGGAKRAAPTWHEDAGPEQKRPRGNGTEDEAHDTEDATCDPAVAAEGRDDARGGGGEGAAPVPWRDFATMYSRLVQFQEEEGHVSPPFHHPELGSWVAELRRQKSRLKQRGLEHEPEDAPHPAEASVTKVEPHDADVAGVPVPVPVPVPVAVAVAEGEAGYPVGAPEDPAAAAENTASELLPTEEKDVDPGAALAATAAAEQKLAGSVDALADSTFLNRFRVELLDSIHFVWSEAPQRLSWHQRLEQLQQFKAEHGRWPTRKNGPLGNWLKKQRQRYAKGDAKFMAHLRPKVRRGEE